MGVDTLVAMTLSERLRDATTEPVTAGKLNFGHIGHWLAIDEDGYIVRAQIVSIAHNPTGEVEGKIGQGKVTVYVRIGKYSNESRIIDFEFHRSDELEIVLPAVRDDLDAPR
ncbi:hypothetical protein CJ469_06179 [Nocardia farcinica]|nr:hypothetical protein CJ469_06179 [Nocardia farcinica]